MLDTILGPSSYDARIRPSGVNGTGERLPLPPDCLILLHSLLSIMRRLSATILSSWSCRTIKRWWVRFRVDFITLYNLEGNTLSQVNFWNEPYLYIFKVGIHSRWNLTKDLGGNAFYPSLFFRLRNSIPYSLS